MGSALGGNCGVKGKQNGDEIMYSAFFSLLLLCAFSFLIHFLQRQTICSAGISAHHLWGAAVFLSIPLIHFPPLPVFHTSEKIQRHFTPCFPGWVEVSAGSRARAVVHQEGRASLQLCSFIPEHFCAPCQAGQPWAPCPRRLQSLLGHHHPSVQGCHQHSQLVEMLCWNASRRF